MNAIAEMIEVSLKKLIVEEEQKEKEKKLPVYNAVCFLCGTVIEVNSRHPLYTKCFIKAKKYLDALSFYEKKYCPKCIKEN